MFFPWASWPSRAGRFSYLGSLLASGRLWAAPVPRREGPEVGLESLDQGWFDSVPRCQPSEFKGAVVLSTLGRFWASVFLTVL